MKYKMRQRILSLSDRFDITDQNDRICYQVQGKILSLGKKLYLRDADGKDLYYIEQKLLRFLAEYDIFYQNEVVLKVKKRLSFLRPKFDVKAADGTWDVEGNFWDHEYALRRNGVTLAQISKSYFTLSDTYGINIQDDVDFDPAAIIALAIVIDMVCHEKRN
ncbi:MAG: LURP-one-related family protein [bacterium]